MEDLWQVLFCEWGVVAIAIAIFFLENSQSRGPLVPILVVSLSASLVLFEHQTDLACP